MADEEKKEADDTEAVDGGKGEEEKGSKGPLKLLVAVAVLIATGGGLAMMAIPKQETEQRFEGPYTHSFFSGEEFVAVTRDDNYSRYVKFDPSCSFVAYTEGYAEQRRADPTYLAALQEAVGDVASRFLMEEIMGGPNRDIFAQLLEKAVEPIVFPVHVGMTSQPFERDSKSGIRAGRSQERLGTFRRPLHDHVLKVDGKSMTISIDDGPEVTYAGDEDDLEVVSEQGEKLYLDVSQVTPDFQGEVPVGIHGRIQRVFLGRVLAQ